MKDNSTMKISVSMKEHEYEDLRLYAFDQRMSKSEFIRNAIALYIEHLDNTSK